MTSDRTKTSHTFRFQAKRSKKLFLSNKKVQKDSEFPQKPFVYLITHQKHQEAIHPVGSDNKAFRAFTIMRARQENREGEAGRQGASYFLLSY